MSILKLTHELDNFSYKDWDTHIKGETLNVISMSNGVCVVMFTDEWNDGKSRQISFPRSQLVNSLALNLALLILLFIVSLNFCAFYIVHSLSRWLDSVSSHLSPFPIFLARLSNQWQACISCYSQQWRHHFHEWAYCWGRWALCESLFLLPLFVSPSPGSFWS